MTSFLYPALLECVFLMEGKTYSCKRCDRDIYHQGRCLPCNYLYKHRKYYPGLRESHNYDKQHGMDTVLVNKLVAEGWTKQPAKIKEPEKATRDYKFEKTCIFCESTFHTNNDKFKSCYKCYKFFSQFGGIKNYGQFLEAFGLNDNVETKEQYIQFVDDVKQFLEIQGDWRIDKILQNPREFLDKVEARKEKPKKRRKQN